GRHGPAAGGGDDPRDVPGPGDGRDRHQHRLRRRLRPLLAALPRRVHSRLHHRDGDRVQPPRRQRGGGAARRPAGGDRLALPAPAPRDPGPRPPDGRLGGPPGRDGRLGRALPAGVRGAGAPLRYLPDRLRQRVPDDDRALPPGPRRRGGKPTADRRLPLGGLRRARGRLRRRLLRRLRPAHRRRAGLHELAALQRGGRPKSDRSGRGGLLPPPGGPRQHRPRRGADGVGVPCPGAAPRPLHRVARRLRADRAPGAERRRGGHHRGHPVQRPRPRGADGAPVRGPLRGVPARGLAPALARPRPTGAGADRFGRHAL
ncbi:MAG: Heme A synthase, cytochrome oxidase biogenesis protein Cox15-CtaA, partial [uncultured Thermomicrobiales bacterium]